jgi:hypothetical protein
VRGELWKGSEQARDPLGGIANRTPRDHNIHIRRVSADRGLRNFAISGFASALPSQPTCFGECRRDCGKHGAAMTANRMRFTPALSFRGTRASLRRQYHRSHGNAHRHSIWCELAGHPSVRQCQLDGDKLTRVSCHDPLSVSWRLWKSKCCVG